MKELISSFPAQLFDALNLFGRQNLCYPSEKINHVLICGLGGSGIGGSIAAEIAERRSKIPVSVCKDYLIPEWVGTDSLVVISSYSGDTEETLNALNQSMNRGAAIICITSGGKIKEIALEKGLQLILIPGGMPPRACLGYSMTQILGIIDQMDFVPGLLKEWEYATNFLQIQSEVIQKEAQEIGRSIASYLPVIYTSAGYEGIAIRMRQQLNENAKMLCWHHVLPEMNHNELVGWVDKSPHISAVFLRNDDEYYRTSKRFEICQEIISRFAEKTLILRSRGNNRLERMLYWIHLGDWISWFASEERNQDAMEIRVINHLKSQLSDLE